MLIFWRLTLEHSLKLHQLFPNSERERCFSASIKCSFMFFCRQHGQQFMLSIFAFLSHMMRPSEYTVMVVGYFSASNTCIMFIVLLYYSCRLNSNSQKWDHDPLAFDFAGVLRFIVTSRSCYLTCQVFAFSTASTFINLVCLVKTFFSLRNITYVSCESVWVQGACNCSKCFMKNGTILCEITLPEAQEFLLHNGENKSPSKKRVIFFP